MLKTVLTFVTKRKRRPVALLKEFSLEIIQKDALESGLEKYSIYIPHDTKLYLPQLPKTSVEKNCQAIQNIRAKGFIPVPHLGVGHYQNLNHIETDLKKYSEVGLKEILLIGGPLEESKGQVRSSLEVLKSGLLTKYGINSVGLAGHPENHREVDTLSLQKALIAKMTAARSAGIHYYVITQFGFSKEPFLDYIASLQEMGLTTELRIGLAGNTNAVKLLKYALLCGVNASTKIAKNRRFTRKSLITYSPEKIIREIAAAPQIKNLSFEVRFHFFTFGSAASTVQMLDKM